MKSLHKTVLLIIVVLLLVSVGVTSFCYAADARVRLKESRLLPLEESDWDETQTKL